MKQEKNILKEALKHFDLGIDFTEEQLTKAYYSQINVIPVDFTSREVDHKKLNKNYEYYVALYKWSKIKFIENNLLKDINLDNVLEEGKPKISNISKSCIEFYSENYIYHSIVNSLLVNIKANYDLFCNIDIENANTIEKVDAYLKNFIDTTKEDFNNFAARMLDAFKNKEASKISNLPKTLSVEINMANSVKDILTIVYEQLKKYIDKKEYLSSYIKLVNENFEKGSVEYVTAMKDYAYMFKMGNSEEFFKLYKDSIEYIYTQIGDGKQKTPTIHGRK